MLLTGTARNVGLVYVDMSGMGRRALLRRAGKTFVKASVSNMSRG
jgi:spartin